MRNANHGAGVSYIYIYINNPHMLVVPCEQSFYIYLVDKNIGKDHLNIL